MSSNSKNSSDSMVMSKLEKNSSKLNISVKELINQYIKLGLYEDDYHEPEPITEEEFVELLRRDSEKDRKRGIPPRKHITDAIVGLVNKYED